MDATPDRKTKRSKPVSNRQTETPSQKMMARIDGLLASIDQVLEQYSKETS